MKRMKLILNYVVIGFTGMLLLSSCLPFNKKENKTNDSLTQNVQKVEKKPEQKPFSINYEKASAIAYDMRRKNALAELRKIGLEELHSKTFQFIHEMAGMKKTGYKDVYGKGMEYKDDNFISKDSNAVGVIAESMYVNTYTFVFADKKMRDAILNKAKEAGFMHNVTDYDTDEKGKESYIMNIDEAREKSLVVYDRDGLYFAEMYVAMEL